MSHSWSCLIPRPKTTVSWTLVPLTQTSTIQTGDRTTGFWKTALQGSYPSCAFTSKPSKDITWIPGLIWRLRIKNTRCKQCQPLKICIILAVKVHQRAAYHWVQTLTSTTAICLLESFYLHDWTLTNQDQTLSTSLNPLFAWRTQWELLVGTLPILVTPSPLFRVLPTNLLLELFLPFVSTRYHIKSFACTPLDPVLVLLSLDLPKTAPVTPSDFLLYCLS
jgi:hypothetical protein